ncbi:aldehyde dehydrogenase family protein [Elusimicrobiota bacterium]
MQDLLKKLGIEDVNPGGCTGSAWLDGKGEELSSINPYDGTVIAKIRQIDGSEYEAIVLKSQEAFKDWQMIPAPKRGEIVRQMALKLREYKKPLGKLVALEMGKILAEGEGEVQEMIDIADYAVGLSRQLYGLSMHSERPSHRMYEQWHPLGTVGVITAFNFPVAVWAWNAMIALVCGDCLIWKPSSSTPLCGIAVHKIMESVLRENSVPEGVLNLIIGSGRTVGELMLNDKRVPLISATGSCRMGYRVGEAVGKRLGRSILELGGNNAIIAMEDTDMDMLIRSVLFGAVGTAGQRCTTTRRLIVHENILNEVTDRLVKSYRQVKIGNPLDEDVLMGPLVNEAAVKVFSDAIRVIKEQGGEILYGGNALSENEYASGYFVEPTIILAKTQLDIIKDETFAPILYIIPFKTIDEAIRIHNDVDQGLSSAMFTNSLRSAETFLSHRGSDCGIANINIGTSGAEIGGAFGGEKETGGGREAGSDAWKLYMRRQTNTINWSTDLPLAQGIKFGD